MAMMLLNKKTLMQGARVMAPVGAGIVAAKVGGALLRKASDAVDAFAASDDGAGWKSGLVDLGGGLAIDLVALAAMARFSSPAKAQAVAPFVVGGTMLGAFAVPLGSAVTDKVMSFVDGLFASSSTAQIQAAERAVMQKAGGRVLDMPQYRGMLGDGEMGRAGGVVATSERAGSIPYAGGVRATTDRAGSIPNAGGAYYDGRVAGGIPDVG